nr:hypothetical protein [Tanacetum cinerariifolium]
MGKSVTELHVMLKLHEQTLPPKEAAPALYAIRVGRIQKNQKKKSHKAAKGNQGKGKAKMGYAPVPAPPFAPKPKNPPTTKKDNITKYAIWHQCGEVGLRGSRKLKPGALSMYVGDDHHASVKAIGEFHLCLPSGLVLILHNCHYDASIARGIILVSHLYKDGFVNYFENNNSISISRNNMIYFNAIPRDDIYEIDLSFSNTNDSSMYAVSIKKGKLNLDSTLPWHCRLGHISKKLIEKLQHDGLLDSTDIKSFEKCVSCMSGKMARKPYSYQVERAKDLLGLIYTDVCGPFKIMSRQRASYVVTFTGDFSRYGYVYLLKHKHEVFETFKVFQKEVENQLVKTIKSLRSDRGALESAARILNMVPTKKVDKTPYEVWHRSTKTRRPIDRLCLYVDAEEHELGYLGEPANYKAALLDLESEKLLNAINVEMQSMRDNEVWELVDIPPNGKTIGHKWFLKKKIDIDGAVHTYKAQHDKSISIESRGDTKRELRFSCYTDAIYLTDADDLKSQTGYVFVLNGGAVEWKSTKQSIFLGVVPTIEEPINMYCDNTRAIKIAKDHGVTKDYALESAARILNMVPTKKVDKTPYEVWHRSIKCIFVGYPKETIGYSFYYPPENKVFVVQNDEFFENSFIDQEASGSLEDVETIQEEDMHPSLDTRLNHE